METSFATARPPASLAPYVLALHGARLSGGEPQRVPELPVAGTAVILALEDHWRIGVDADSPLIRHASFAGGLTLAPAVSEHAGAYDLVELVLTPLGTAAVLDVPDAALAGAVVPLDDVLGGEAARLTERLAALPGWGDRFAATERWLLARVARRSRWLSPDVTWALQRVEATGGRVAIGTLQAELGCSRRHLATRFAESVGTTPKAYAQLVRFGRAAASLRAGQAPATVAAAYGYADQSHLTRHVQRFAATTPALLRRQGAAPVTSVQDAQDSRA